MNSHRLRSGVLMTPISTTTVSARAKRYKSHRWSRSQALVTTTTTQRDDGDGGEREDESSAEDIYNEDTIKLVADYKPSRAVTLKMPFKKVKAELVKAELPDRYDSEQIEAYFSTYPGRLAKRAATLSVMSSAMGFMFATGKYAALADTLSRMGPTFVKFGQALASRPDIVGVKLAAELQMLQDNVPPIPNKTAREIVASQAPGLMESLSATPVAAASLCSVYKAVVGGRPVAVKVQRPGLREMIAADARLLRLGASAVEGIQGADGQRIVRAEAVAAVDEFCSRLFEELDFENEANNLELFDRLYGPGGSAADSVPSPGVRVPKLYRHLSSENVLVMEWLQGTKLVTDSQVKPEDFPLVELGIRCTLSQLLETGVMHADPHGGNLLKVDGQLGYIDFGLVSIVPQQVRDGLVCAVALLVVERDYQAVANLFGELMLMPAEVVEDPVVMADFANALERAGGELLDFSQSEVPQLRFDRLIEALVSIAPRFRFQLPPYFLNNARAIGTLEGMAKSVYPDFNVLSVVYPYAVKRLLSDPGASPVVQRTLVQVTHTRQGRFSPAKLRRLVADASVMTRVPQWRIVLDAVFSKGGQAFALQVIRTHVLEKLAVAGLMVRWGLDEHFHWLAPVRDAMGKPVMWVLGPLVRWYQGWREGRIEWINRVSRALRYTVWVLAY